MSQPMRGLSIFRSNRLEALVTLLAQLAGGTGQTPMDPMVPMRIVVGGGGMARWLEHRLAERWGVFTHTELVFPARALREIATATLGSDTEDTQSRSLWDGDALTWAVLEVFTEVQTSEDPVYAPLRAYLDAEPAQLEVGAVSARVYGLARQIADVFDRYLTFRGPLVCGWGAGEVGALPESIAWQPALWAALVVRLGAKHTASEAAALLTALETDVEINLNQPIRVFGVSHLPPAWLQTLAALADKHPVELYLLCPSNLYWADLHQRRDRFAVLKDEPRETLDEWLREDGAVPGNPLLAGLGRVMRDFQVALEALPDGLLSDRLDLFIDDAEGNPLAVAFADPAEGEGCSALARLQSDVLAASLSRAQPLDPDDDSVQLHSCHGPIRQVEVLREVLLGLFERYPELEPRDVVVMSPQIEAYAPLVSAVFDPGGVDVPAIPYTVADLSLRRGNAVAEALLALLKVSEARLTAASVLGLLGIAPIRDRFQMSLDDVSTARGWLVNSGARWGADGPDRAAEGQPNDVLNTLRFGMDRLLLGLCVSDEAGHELAGVRPFDRLTPRDGPLLGHLVDFVTRIAALRTELRSPRTIEAWCEWLTGTLTAPGLLQTFMDTSSGTARLMRGVHDEISAMAEGADRVASSRTLDVGAVRAALTARLEQTGTQGPRAHGGVTFSSLVPMRGLPHQVVCLLGMDEGCFPRKRVRRAFDLVSLRPKLGDRDAADDDRGALLESILAARAHLVVLYTGRDVRTNEVQPPAVPIGELADVLDATFAAPEGFERASEALTRVHPLQVFSPRNFEAAAPFSFDVRLAEAAEASRRQARSPRPFFEQVDELGGDASAGERLREIDLEVLATFVRSPHRALLRQRFGLYLQDDGAEEVPEREPFELGGLDRWGVQQALLEGLTAKQPLGEVVARLRAEGRLPLGYAATVWLEDPIKLASGLSVAVNALPAADDVMTLGGVIDGRPVVGTVAGLRGPIDLVCRFSADSTTRGWSWTLRPWVRLLGRQLVAPDPQAAVWVLHYNKSAKRSPLQWRTFGLKAGVDARDEARRHLTALVALMDEAQHRPVPLLPNGSYQFAKMFAKMLADVPAERGALSEVLEVQREHDLAGYNKAVGAVEKAWSPYSGRGDADDPDIEQLFGGQCPAFSEAGRFSADFAATALALWRPIIAARGVLKKQPVFPGGKS